MGNFNSRENKDYAIAHVQPNDMTGEWTRLVYETCTNTASGEEILGGIKDAYFFTQEEIGEFFSKSWRFNDWMVGCVVIHCPDCTKEMIDKNSILEAKYNSTACIR